jgi:agmatinase
MEMRSANMISPGRASSRASRLVLSPMLEIESQNDRTITVFDCETGRRRRLSHSLYRLMKKFEKPENLADVVPHHQLAQLEQLFDQLVSAGFLLEVDCPPRRLHNDLKPVANTLFRSPARGTGHGRPDLAVIGIPFDGGNVIGPGARQGPSELRLHSWQYPYRINFDTAAPAGWFDVDTESTILDGITISDWGDVQFTHGETTETLFQRAENVVREIVQSGSFPLCIGGDHSVTYPVVNALQQKQPLTVIWLDAHLDRGLLHPGCCHNHKNVARRILQLPNVRQVTTIGYRGYASGDPVTVPPSRMEIVTPSRLRRMGIASVVDALPASDPCYISLDIDVLDPSCAPGTATPVPGGLRPEELKELLRAIGKQRTIAGMDLVELNPLRDPSGVTCLLACELLLAALGSALAHRTRQIEAGDKICIMEFELWKSQ